MKINTKIVLTILEISLIPWALGGVITYLSAQEQINVKTITDLSAFADIQKNRLEDTLQNKLDILSVFTSSSELKAEVANFNARHTAASRAVIQNRLASGLKNVMAIRKVFIASTEGVIIASSDLALVGTDVRAEEYFRRGLRANDASVLKKDSRGLVSHYLAGPLVSNGDAEGVLVVVADADDVIGVSQDFAGFGQTGETLLAMKVNDTEALFLTPTRFDPDAALTRMVSYGKTDVPALHAAAGEESVFMNLVDYRGVEVFAATRHIPSVGWGIVVKVDRSEALASVKKLQELFAVIIVLIGLLILVVGVSISRSITKPIQDLTVLANKISKGNPRQSIVVTTRDEIGVLATAFNEMVYSLWEANNTLEKNVLARTHELAERTKEARDSEKAALNIAEDLKEEEERLALEKTNAEILANDLLKFKLALDNASDQIVITDPEGIVVYVNPVIEKTTGYTQEEVVGKKSGALWKSPMSAEFYQDLWRTIKEEKKPFTGELQNRRKNGELYTALATISPVVNKEGKIIFFVGVERDITREKEIDTAKDEFISLASHQMRTPITIINWYSEMLLEGDAGALSKRQKEYFDEIYVAAQKMNDIVKAFMHILRLETGSVATNPVPVDLVDVAKAIIKDTQLAIDKKHLHVIEKYEKSLPQLSVDEELLRIILQNLVSNAAKYSSDGGDMEIVLATAEQENVVAGKTVQEDSILISVRDTGIGISEGDQGKIFSKFFRAENAKRLDPNGNGLGLYMTKFMVDIVGGRIWLESEEGRGTTFYLLLPLVHRKS